MTSGPSTQSFTLNRKRSGSSWKIKAMRIYGYWELLNGHRYLDGLKFIDDTASQWQPRSGLVQHMWWHKALLNIESENYEGAVAIFDDHLLGGATRGRFDKKEMVWGPGLLFHLDPVCTREQCFSSVRCCFPSPSFGTGGSRSRGLSEGQVARGGPALRGPRGRGRRQFVLRLSRARGYPLRRKGGLRPGRDWARLKLTPSCLVSQDAWAGRIYDLTTAVGDERRGKKSGQKASRIEFSTLGSLQVGSPTWTGASLSHSSTASPRSPRATTTRPWNTWCPFATTWWVGYR